MMLVMTMTGPILPKSGQRKYLSTNVGPTDLNTSQTEMSIMNEGKNIMRITINTNIIQKLVRGTIDKFTNIMNKLMETDINNIDGSKSVVENEEESKIHLLRKMYARI